MNALAPHIQRQIEQYADGELTSGAVREVEAILSNSAAARSYLHALEEIRLLPQVALDDLTADIDFARMEDSIMQAVLANVQTPATQSGRIAELEMLTAQWVDGELHDPRQVQRVFDYLAQNAEARDAVESIRELQRVTRDYVRVVDDSVDFDALYERSLVSLGMQVAAAPLAAPAVTTDPADDGKVVSLNSWLQRFKAPLAAAAGIAAATAIMLPLSLNTNKGTTIHNNYYLTNVDNMDVEPGHSGTIVQSKGNATPPVVWISSEAGSAPPPFDEQAAPPVRSKHPAAPDDRDADDDVLDI